MKPYEILYLTLEPFLPPLYGKTRKLLRNVLSSQGFRPDVLDVGGRRSNYTIGVPANVTITDLPRETPIQQDLNLGLDLGMMAKICERRSNVDKIVFDDMTRSQMMDSSFDCVVAVEVLEHVKEDEAFLREVSRVLRPGKTFIMTTPNGEFVSNTNPDHVRHYTRLQLHALLSSYFQSVDVHYAMQAGKLYTMGLRSWSASHPVRTMATMMSAFVSGIQSDSHQVESHATGTHQLIAVAKK